MRIELGSSVVDSSGTAVGDVAGVVFEGESWRVAGFVFRMGGVVPREVVVAPGQVDEIDADRLALTLEAAELELYPDARQHQYVEPARDPAATDDGAPPPDDGPVATIVPGFAMLPGLGIPLEVERSVIPDTRFTFGEALRAVSPTGEDLGQVVAVAIEGARLVGIELRGGRAIPDRLLLGIDEDANEVLVAEDDATEAPLVDTVE